MYTFSDLTSTIITKEELDEFISELDVFIDSLYISKETVEQKFNTHISFDKRERLLSLCKGARIDLNNISGLKDFLVTLKQQLKELPILELTIAFHPHRDFLSKVSLWCFQKMEKNVILSVSLERAIIGGTMISFAGIYRDFSMQKLVQDRIKEGKIFPRL